MSIKQRPAGKLFMSRDLPVRISTADPSASSHLIDRLKRLYMGGDLPPTYVLTRWVFFRLLGLIYFFAFLSFWLQALGLIGSNGILPVSDFVVYVNQAFGSSTFWHIPTLLLFNSSDSSLLLLCGAGTVLAVLVI